MPRLMVSLLGGFQVSVDDTIVTAFRSDKARALLAYLSVNTARPSRREYLADLLWPDQTEQAALTNLRQTLARLRRALSDQDSSSPALLITPHSVQYNLASDVWLDVATFTALLAQCDEHPHASLEQLASTAAVRGVSVSDTAVHDRFT